MAVVAGAPAGWHRDSSSTYALDVLGFDLSTNRRKTALGSDFPTRGRPRIAEARRGLPPEEVAARLAQPNLRDGGDRRAIRLAEPHFVDFLSSGGARALSRSPAHAGWFSGQAMDNGLLGSAAHRSRTAGARGGNISMQGAARKRIRPLSVSFDKLGATAAMWAWIRLHSARQRVKRVRKQPDRIGMSDLRNLSFGTTGGVGRQETASPIGLAFSSCSISMRQSSQTMTAWHLSPATTSATLWRAPYGAGPPRWSPDDRAQRRGSEISH